MSSYKIETIEGIGPAFRKKLAAAGIATTGKLLTACATRKGRADMAKKTGLTEPQLLKWTNMADLLRVKGVGEEYSELLEAAGVDTVKELKTRRADALTTKMAEINAKKKLVRQTPAQTMVERWIKHAKTLNAVISY